MPIAPILTGGVAIALWVLNRMYPKLPRSVEVLLLFVALMCIAISFLQPFDSLWLRDLGFVAAAIIAAFWFVHSRQKATIPKLPSKIRLLDLSIATQAGATFPLKCYARLRNDGPSAVAIELANYTADAVRLKELVRSVLQIMIEEEWRPKLKAFDRVALLPGQECRLWLGLDDQAHTQRTAEALRGHLGTLVLNVNGEPVEIPL